MAPLPSGWHKEKGKKFPVDKDRKSRSQIEKELYDAEPRSGLRKTPSISCRHCLSEMSWKELVKQATNFDISIYKSQKTESEGPKRNPFKIKLM